MGLPKRPVRKVEVMQGSKLLPKSRARPWGIQMRKRNECGMDVLAYIDRWIHGWMDSWMDGWMDSWMDGWMDGCTDCYVRFLRSD